MKTIEPIQIWDNGEIKTASILNVYGNSIVLNENANFVYTIYTLKNDGNLDNYIANGNIFMPYEQYIQWDQDEFAWDFVANSLNLTITGDYAPPQIVDENLESNPESL